MELSELGLLACQGGLGVIAPVTNLRLGQPRFAAPRNWRHSAYLHNGTLVGEMLRYIARDETGAWVALLGYSSASLHLEVRDE